MPDLSERLQEIRVNGAERGAEMYARHRAEIDELERKARRHDRRMIVVQVLMILVGIGVTVYEFLS